MTRLVVLTPEEKKTFNSPPVFNSIDRKKHFSFSPGILDIANKLTKPQNRIFFLVTYGYFKATYRFYNAQLLSKDTMHTAEKLGITEEIWSTATYNIRSGGEI